jgi:hypothetical protein
MFNCGGGSGSSNSPKGENPGEPSIVQLLPAQFVAQTNSIITLHAKVLDGNGAPVNNIPVSFTNLSPIGILNATTAQTNNAGIATVTLKSTTSGFSTVQAEVNKGTGQVRVRKTVYFSLFDMILPTPSEPPSPSLTLAVDGDNDKNFNEADDLILFQSSTDNQVIVKAKVYNSSGRVVSGSAVTFGADSLEASFPLGNIKTTDGNGEAFVLVQVDPIAIRNLETVLNITAEADNGASNMVSLFLKPITVSASSSSLFANPTVIAPGRTSDLTATVKLSTGGVPPDGTTVSFTSTCGTVTPFAQTTNGVAPAVFTAPAEEGPCTLTATAGGVTIGRVDVTVAIGGGGGSDDDDDDDIPISISPMTATVAGIKNPDSSDVDNLTFALSNTFGANCISSQPAIIASPAFVGILIFEIDPDEVSVTTPVTITCTDVFDGSVATTVVTVTPPALTIRLNPILVIGRANPAGGDGNTRDDVTVEVVGGVGPYIVNIEPFALTTIVPGGPWANTVPWSFLVDPTNVLTNTVVTFKVTDGIGSTATAQLVVYTENTPLVASTSKENVIGLANPDGDPADDVMISVAGANGPFIVSWVCNTPDAVAATASVTSGTGSCPGGIGPCVVSGIGPVISGTITFDPGAYTGAQPSKACTVNVTDNFGSAATLNISIWP